MQSHELRNFLMDSYLNLKLLSSQIGLTKVVLRSEFK